MKAAELKKLGFFSMILLGINGIIGSGIFLLPGKVVSIAGSWSLVIYAFVSLIVLATAWCFAQCAGRFTRNGGAYIYAKEAFGDFIGFEVGIMRWAVGIIAWAAMAVGFITALSSIWPAADQEPFRSLIILSLVGGLGLVNILGVGVLQKVNNLFTLAKVIPLLLLILMGIFYVKQTYPIALAVDQPVQESFRSASLIIFYAFGGFEALTVAAEDMENPTKNLPVVMMIVITFCSLIYFLIHWIATGILGPVYLAESITPIADVAQKIFGSLGKWFVTVATLISIGGTNIAASFITPRSGVALAEDRMIPAIIAVKSRFGTPYLAISITMILTAVVAVTGDFTQLITISVLARFVQYISTCLATLVMHVRPLSSMTLRHSWKCIIPLIALVGIVWLLLQASSQQLYMSLGALLLGIPLYMLQRKALILDKPLSKLE